MQRRSAQRAAPRKKYTVDAFDAVPELQDSVAAEQEAQAGAGQDEESSDDFQAPLEQKVSNDDSAMSGAEEEAPAEDSDAGERDVNGNASIVDDAELATLSKPRKKIKRSRSGETLYTRGLDDIHRNTSWLARRLLFFGPLPEDHEPAQKARTKWSGDPTLPRRREDANGNGGYHHSFFYDEARRQKATRESWLWYYEAGGAEAFDSRQNLQQISLEEAREYMPASKHTRDFVMGPAEDQKLFRLRTGQSVSLLEAWKSDAPMPTNYKTGFVINIGAKVSCLDWTPNRLGRDQYLAASTYAIRTPSGDWPEHSSAPAFTAQPPWKSCIQIYRAKAGEDDVIDATTPPLQISTICMEWGDIRVFKWCPAPCEDTGMLGLLAIVSGDGALRVVRVPLPTDRDETSYLRVDAVVFESRPPDTLYTCLSWLSSSRIAVGCANGFVAVWDLHPTLSSAEVARVRPAIYAPISTSYVLSIQSCYPSRPYLLIATSMAGYLTVTDLRHPQPASPAATASSQRSRLGQPLLLWHDYMQSALSVDDLYTVRAYPLRRWFNVVFTARAKGVGTALAASPCHPSVLLGTASGQVMAENPMAKFTRTRSEAWQQTWFEHEWRRPTAAEQAADDEDESANDEGDASFTTTKTVGRNGLSRFLEGFKAERQNLSHEQMEKHNSKDGVLYHTIHEKETAITALAWNPNLHVGGWAAAGMGNGLVRIEDLGL
ncbi:hypothetical protein B0A50_04641 [Salinomyces thailandicus]|uniref:Transcription factor TFIIIC complex subunit Tfc6 n=1 Tax=Salinomyces thailandicus TaxID=706561 RepID=A0A4U0TV54_9PEZI|nr:hypothetical protein B0A50_04641 [Salinomyces thailandica]